MHDFLTKILSWTGEEGKFHIAAFNIWHFVYLAIIICAITLATITLRKKDSENQKKALNILSVTVLCWYITNFFLQPFVRANDQLNIDKLPFHICTLMSIVGVFAQFSKKDWFKEVAVTLAMAGSLMYLTYPSSAFGGEAPWSFFVMETMGYHSLLFAWGFLSLVTGQVKLHYKKMYMPLVGILCIACWATLGNLSYNVNYASGSPHYDWFFLTGSSFGIPPYIMPFLLVAAVYGVVACFYLINYIIEVIAKKKQTKN